MNILSPIVTFQNLHEVRRLCHWGPVVALSVIAMCSSMAVLDSIIWYWPLDTTGGSINFIMLINWSVLILYNYFNAMFLGPGRIPLEWKPVINQSVNQSISQSINQSINQSVDQSVHQSIKESVCSAVKFYLQSAAVQVNKV